MCSESDKFEAFEAFKARLFDVLQECLEKVSREFQECFEIVLRLFKGGFKNVSRMILEFF